MRISSIAMIVFGLLFMLAVTACPGGGGGDKPPPPGQPAPDAPDESDAPEILGIEGTNFGKFMEMWVEVGEDEDDLLRIAELDREGDFIDPLRWRIAEIAKDTVDSYEIDMGEGDYKVRGLGGKGLAKLYMYVYGEDPVSGDDYLDCDESEDVIPILIFSLDNDQIIRLVVAPPPWEFVEDRESAIYCWAIYED